MEAVYPDQLAVTVTAVPDRIPEPGGEISFTVKVVNVSPDNAVQLLRIAHDIDNDGAVDVTRQASEICRNTFLSAPPAAGTTTCTFTRELTGNAGDRLTGKITVSGLDKLDRRARGTDTATVTVTDIPAAIQVDKLVEPTILEVPGGPVSFVVTVTNISEVDDVSITAINDPDFGDDIREFCFNDPGGPAEVDFPATLAPGGSITCTTPGTVIGRDGERIVRTASAEGIDDEGNPVTDDGSATVIIQKKITSVGLGKFVMPEQIPEPGGPVKYLLEITNASAKDGVTINRVMYSEGGDLQARDCSPKLPAFLAPGEMAICTTVKTVTGNAGDIMENTATASGTNDAGQVGEVWVKTRVKILDVPSSIQVIKDVSPAMVSERGGAVTFTVRVVNTSAVDTVTLEKIDDPGLGGDISKFCATSLPVALQPGEDITCTIPHVIEGSGGRKKISSTTIASGTDDDNNPVSGEDEAVVHIIDIPSSILTEVSASPASVPAIGGETVFSVSVRNTSALDTVTILSVADTVYGDVSSSCRPEPPVDLKPGKKVNCSFRERIAGRAGDEHTSTITASGMDDDGNQLASSGDVAVSFEQVPESEPVKTAPDPGRPDDGSTDALPPAPETAMQADDSELSSGEEEDTGPRFCMGKITRLSMVYHGPYSEQVMIKDTDSRVLFSEEVYPDEPFTFTGRDSEGTCTDEVKIYVNWRYHTTITTDCSVDIGPGFRSGDFEVVKGRSSYGGSLGRVDQ